MTKVLPASLIWAVLMLSFKIGLTQNKVALEQANCIVVVPGTMKLFTDSIQTDIGQIVYYTYVCKDSSLQYQLSYCEYPEGSLHSDSTELLREFFSATLAASTEKLQGTQRYASEIVQFGYPGWFWRIDYGKNRFSKTKAFVAGRKFYKLEVLGNRNDDQENRSTLYFDSFQFIDLNKNRR